MDNKIIYFDNAATTIVDPSILNSYNEVNKQFIGNAGSIHIEGQKAFRLLDKSRQQILDWLNLLEHKVIYTSGATEANNLAIKGYCLRYKNRGKHIIVSSIEHPSILESARQLEFFGFEVTYLPVNNLGTVDINELKASIREDTIFVSIMAVNNETGAINPIEAIAEMLKGYPKICFHTDATQAIGKVRVDYRDCDMVTFSGHKIHGLNGGGALLIKKKLELLPIMTGGGQEDNLRSGTNDVPMAVSLAKSVRLSIDRFIDNYNKVKRLSDKLREFLMNNEDKYELNSYYPNNPYIVNFSLKEHKAAVVVEGLSNEGIMVSSTSACHSHNETGSYVVKAMGKDEWLSHNTIRVSFSPSNTLDEVNTFIETLLKIERGIKQ